MKTRYLLISFLLFLAALIVSATPSRGGTFGCLVGAAGGGFGGAQIGSGSGQLAATAAGTLLGCALGSNLQDRDSHIHRGHVHDSWEYQTYKQRYGGYTMTQYGYVPINRATGYVTTRPGYTFSRSIYYDQRPEVFGIYPVRRRVVEHVVTSPPAVQRPTPHYTGCALYNGEPYLREYQSTVVVGGRNVPAYGTACYQPDGSWKLISELVPAH